MKMKKKKNKTKPLMIEKTDNGYLVPIDLIDFDENNPRINQYLLASELRSGTRGRQFSKEQHIQALVDITSADAGSKDFEPFAESIRKAGKIYNPIGIMPKDKTQTSFRCLRGNTRLAVYHHLREEYPDEVHWNKIPCLIEYQPDELEIVVQRLIDHVNRTRDWNPSCFPEAATELLKKHGYEKLKEISESLGYNEKYLKTQLEAFKLYKKFEVPLYKKNVDGLARQSQFSIWVTYIDNSKVRKAVDTNGGPKKLAEWIVNGKFPKRLDIRLLPKILEVPEAKREFLRNDAASAEPLVKQDEFLNMPFYQFADLFRTRCHDRIKENYKTKTFFTNPATNILKAISKELKESLK